ncbi:hypothetical protein N0824_01020 [Microcystis sp. 0824]|uniref:Uncharacterized protein n=1 Tax=Microcystis aeruginosa NIES-2521 TaxID=2303983 RepID=A0A5A5RZD1_MICAE|nr:MULTISPECIES: lysozyme inhibitor LprI family protein [Microcystis]GBF53168.1 hypothetical protein N0824_01020 [Microcystis sp. 0824]GCA80418.1 hypothetical protein MiTs_02425 [Microcystis aeruginosa NIES-2521]
MGGNLYGANPDLTQAKKALAQIDTIFYVATKPNLGHFRSCEFERSAYEGGSLAPMIYGFCLANVTEQRTKDLQRYLEDSDL